MCVRAGSTNRTSAPDETVIVLAAFQGGRGSLPTCRAMQLGSLGMQRNSGRPEENAVARPWRLSFVGRVHCRQRCRWPQLYITWSLTEKVCCRSQVRRSGLRLDGVKVQCVKNTSEIEGLPLSRRVALSPPWAAPWGTALAGCRCTLVAVVAVLRSLRWGPEKL